TGRRYARLRHARRASEPHDGPAAGRAEPARALRKVGEHRSSGGGRRARSGQPPRGDRHVRRGAAAPRRRPRGHDRPDARAGARGSHRPQPARLRAAPGGSIVIGARRWAYEPGQSLPKRASDPGDSRFPRVSERRPARVEFADGQPGTLIFVADSGPGVTPEDREKIFEPFYTTKAPGQGTGLGLAIVARSVHDMGGVVWVDNAREGGAAFKLFFPIAIP